MEPVSARSGTQEVLRSAVPCFHGLDGATAQVDMAIRPSGERWAVPNDTHGVMTLVDRLQALQPPRIVLEAPGGLERLGTSALATAGLPVVVVNPRQARDFARATGQLAQTDAWDARALAHGAEVIRPTPRPLPEAQTQELRALLGRRQQRSILRTAEPHRLAGTSERLTQDITVHMAWRHARIATLDDDRETRLRACPLWRAHDDRVQRAPGMGPGWARTFLLELPALGTRTGQQIAALVGVAPLHGARGTLRGRRRLGGGRAPGRTVFSLGTLVATRFTPRIKAFDERLRAAGTRNKVALTACMHQLLTILNAMLTPRTP
jgi:transposase